MRPAYNGETALVPLPPPGAGVARDIGNAPSFVAKHPVEMRTHKGRQMGYLRELTFPNEYIPIHEKLVDSYFGYVETAELTRLSKVHLSQEGYLPPS